MSDYALYYWPVPFRGQFIRAILAHAGKTWDEFDAGDIDALMKLEPAAQPIPFMGPPVLVERTTGVVLAEMPAIVYYLGETLGLMPARIADRAWALKVVNDANDVIDELSSNGGQTMWSKTSWQAFVPRLERWMAIWEATATRHGAAAGHGFLLGTAHATIADIVTATLWTTMGERFPTIAAVLDDKAPITAGLSERMSATPALTQLRTITTSRFGDVYCGGEIEKSMRRVIV